MMHRGWSLSPRVSAGQVVDFGYLHNSQSTLWAVMDARISRCGQICLLYRPDKVPDSPDTGHSTCYHGQTGLVVQSVTGSSMCI